MLKTLGTVASLSAAHLAQAEQVLAQAVHKNTLPDSGTPEAPKPVRSNVKAKRHHPRFQPDIEDDRHLQHSVMRDWHRGRNLQDTEVCSRAINRMKDEQADFNELLQRGSQDSKFEFTDETFEFPESIHWEDLPALQWNLDWDVENLSWKRIKDVFAESYFSLWGSRKINPEDAIQGQLGNCWLIVAAMSIAEDPQRIKDIFQVEQKNSAGVYAAKMWLLGMPTSVVIDDYLPLDKYGDGQSTRYANIAEDGALWGTLFEKAFAKYLGMYEAIDAGGGSHGIEAMTGSPTETFGHKEVLSDQNIYEQLWQRLLDSDQTGEMITSGSYTGTGNDQDTNDVGLPYNHAFSIMRALEVYTAIGSERLVEIRNPWGEETYWGDWSDSSDRWTEQMREQVGHYTDDDGKFYMSFDDYIQNMEYTEFNLNIFGWNHSQFAVFGDDEPFNRQEVWNDGFEYNVHNLFLISEIDQEVYLSAHTYHFKHYHGACSEGYYDSEVLVKRQEDQYYYVFNPGSIHSGVSYLEAGKPYSVEVLSRFGEADMVPHDWSVVAWAKDLPVQIYHEAGRQSDTFRLLKDADQTDLPQDFDLSQTELLRLEELTQGFLLSEDEQAELYQLTARLYSYMERNGLTDQAFEDVLQDLLNSDKPVIDPSSGPSKDILNELVKLHELANSDEPMSDEEWNRFYDLYWEVEEWLYYDAGIFDKDPIDYAYETIGGTNPLGGEPSKEELLILEEFYFRDWSELKPDMKAEIQRVLNKIIDYMYYEQLWDLTPFQYAVEILGREQSEVELTDEALEHFLDLNHKDWFTFTDQDYIDEMLLYYKLNAYMIQNDIVGSDPIRLANELLENEPTPVDPTNEYPRDLLEELLRLHALVETSDIDEEGYYRYMDLLMGVQIYLYEELGAFDKDPISYAAEVTGTELVLKGKPTKEELLKLEELYYRDWNDLNPEMKAQLVDIIYKVYDYIEQEQLWDTTPIQYATEVLGKSEPQKIQLSEEGLRQFIDLMEAEYWGLSDDDQQDLDLLWFKMDAYIAQNGLWNRDPYVIARELLDGENTSNEFDEKSLWRLKDFLDEGEWPKLTDEDKSELLKIWREVMDTMYAQGEFEKGIDTYLYDNLNLEQEIKVDFSKEGLKHLIYLYPLSGDQMTDQDWIDWDLLWGKFAVHAEQTGFWERQQDPLDALYELLDGGNFVDPVDPVDPVNPVDPVDPTDPYEGPSKDNLKELIYLHELMNGPDSSSISLEDQVRFYDLFWEVEEWLYYDAGIFDKDPIDYAYEIIGGTNLLGEEPSKEELMILEELYYKNWSDLPEDMKAEYQRVLDKVWSYIQYKNLYDMTPLQLAAEMLGKGQAEYVTLSPEAAERLIELSETNWDDLTDKERTEDALLWAKLSAYMAQNDLWNRDPMQVAKELIGDAPINGNEFSEKDLQQLYDFYFSDAWTYFNDENKKKLAAVIAAIEERLYFEGDWETTVAQYVSKSLGKEPMPEIYWTEDGLSTLVYLYDLPSVEMSDQDWSEWALLYGKWYAYVVQENISFSDESNSFDVMISLLNEFSPIKYESYELVDLTGDYGLHMDIQVVYSKPEKNLRMSAYSDPNTDVWQFSLQSGADRVHFSHAGEGEPQSSWTFEDGKSAWFNTGCPYETVECSGKESLPKWEIAYEWKPENQLMIIEAVESYNRRLVVHLDTEFSSVSVEVYGEDDSEIAYKYFTMAAPSMFERVQYANKYSEKADGEQYKVQESLDYFRGQQGNHTVAIQNENNNTIFNATFVIVSPNFATTNVIIDFEKGKTAHIGCSPYSYESMQNMTSWNDTDWGFNMTDWNETDWGFNATTLNETTIQEDFLNDIINDLEFGLNRQEAPIEGMTDDIMPADECHAHRNFGGWDFELNVHTDQVYLSWYNSDIDAHFTTTIYSQDERAERVDYWPNWIVVSDWDLTQAPVKASSVDLLYFDETTTGVDLSFEIVSPSLEAMYLNDNIQVYDSTNMHQYLELTDYFSFDCGLQQSIRQNETDRDMVMMLSSDDASILEYTTEKQLKLAPGFTREEYSFSPDGKINVDYSITQEEEGRFSQNITLGETGVCIFQVVDFNINVWSRELMTDNCTTSQSFMEWSFPQGYGPLSEDPAFGAEEDSVDFEEAFQEGFNEGFDQAEIEQLSEDKVDPDQIRKYEMAMPAWIDEQDLQGSIFTCDSGVRIDHPFIEDDRMWALWASHDCADYDLKLTVVLTKETKANNVGYYGAELDAAGCQETIYFEGALACEFTIKYNQKFAMLFQGGFSPVYYTTEFVREVAFSFASSWW